jgi:hypothetical protein
MTDPINPSTELVQEWIQEADGGHDPRWQDYEQDIATRAAKWGADQELEACCEWILNETSDEGFIANLRAARRPKPPSLKEQALMALEDGDTAPGASLTSNEVDIIRRALEALPDD